MGMLSEIKSQVFEEEGATSRDCWSIADARILPMATQHDPQDGPIAIGSESRNGNAAQDQISGLRYLLDSRVRGMSQVYVSGM
jgi:hypothetical protein